MIDDPLAESLAKKDRERNQFSGSARVGVQQNPDEFAKALKLAAETGVTPEAVLRDMKAYDESARAARIAQIYDTHPKTSKWMVDNPAIAHDDLASIVKLEPVVDAVKPIDTGFWETALGSFIQGSGRIPRQLTDLSRLGQAMHGESFRSYARLVDRLVGNNVASRGVERGLGLAEEARSRFDVAVSDPAMETGKKMINPDRWGAQLFSTAPDILTGLATAGLGPTATAIGKVPAGLNAGKALIFKVGQYLAARTPQIAAQTATSFPSVLSSEIDQMQQNAPGMDRVTAAGQAAPSAVVQSMLEGLVEVPIIERAQKAKGVVKRIAGLLASSGMEGAEEVAQAITSQYLLPDPTGQRKLELSDLWENARGGFIVGAVFGGGAMVAKPMKVTPEETFFKALDEGAKESKLLKRMPEKYQELLAHLTKDGPVETVGIPVQQWETYWQSKDVDPVAKAMELGVDAEAYQNAVTLADDLTISTAAFGTKIAGTEDFAGLIPDVRYRQGMETARESERSAADEKAAVDEILARFQATPEEGVAVEISTLKETLKQQLIDAGRPQKEADAQATLFERSIATLAVRNDMTPEDLLSRFTLKVNNGQVWAQPMSDVMGGAGDVAPMASEDFELDPWNTMYQSGQVQKVGLPVVDSTSYKGKRQGTLMGPNDEQLVARDPETGEDIGRLWLTRTNGGFEVRKVETDPAFQGRGVATKLYREANSRFGTYQGSTDQTPEGKAFVERLRQTDPQIFDEAAAALTPEGSGTALLSNEEVSRAQRGDVYYRVDRSGRVTFLGPQPDAPVRDGEAIIMVSGQTGQPQVQNSEGLGTDQEVLARVGGAVMRAHQAGRSLAPKILYQSVSSLGFYSALQNAIPGLSKIASKNGMVAVDQAKSWLSARQKEGKFKQAELDAVGLPEWLDLQKGKVSVEGIAAFVEQNGVQIREVMKSNTSPYNYQGNEWQTAINAAEARGDWDEAERINRAWEGVDEETGSAAGMPKFGDYQLPGGTNYRELLLTLPSRATQSRSFDQWLLDTGRGELASIPDGDLPILRKQYDGDERNYNKSNDFQSSHWDEKNILSHIRFNERTDSEGKKVLFIEEIQSDWGQKGKKEGFGDKGVPSAPFVTDTKAWVALSIKRMIRYAAENGFDKVAFINGEQSADRYDLSKSVSRVVWSETSKTLKALDLKGNTIIDKRGVEATELEDYIGKEAAQKLIDTEPNNLGIHQLDSDGLKVGGEGMKAFYDKIVPSVAGDVLKKLGGKVEDVSLESKVPAYVSEMNGQWYVTQGEQETVFNSKSKAEQFARDEEGRELNQPGFTITPEMKARVMEEGQTLFQPMKRRPEDYKRLRARLASLRSLSPTHQAGELTRRALEAKAIEAEFRAFDKAAMEIGDIEGKRAYLQIGPDHSFNLGLLKNANVSSASHEFGHFYLEILSDLAGRENATQQVRDDYETIVNAYGTDGVIDRDGHERFADAHLLYLSEGRAPSVGLQGAFQRFSTWLAKVWTVIKADMVDVQLTDEVRGVFDRLYATDAEIEAVKDSLGRPMFRTAEEMGRTKDQFAVYLRAEETRKAEAREAAMRVLMLEMKRENSKEWADLYETVHARVKSEVEARPEYVALLSLTAKDSETRMSKQALLDRGVDLKSLAQDGIKYVYSDKSTMDPDTAATLLGFETGDQLIQALTGLESRVALAERLTMDEVHRTFPDTMEDPVALRELALKVLADSEAASDRMALEAQVLRDKLNEGKAAAKAKLPNLQAYRQAAIQMIQGMNAFDLRPFRYLQARGKASNAAYRANAKGDYAAAVEAKEREILNHFLYMESLKVRDDLDRFWAFDKKFDSAATREKIGKAGGSFLEQIDAVRLRFGLSPFPGENMGQRTETLAEWVAANEYAEIDDRVIDETWRKPVKDMTVAELNSVWDALKNIKRLAYAEMNFAVKGQQVSYELAGLEISEGIAKHNKLTPGHISGYKESAKEKAINHLKGWDAMMVKVEALVNWMDGKNVNGPAHRYLWQPLVDAQTARYDMTVKMALPLQEALRQMPEAQRKSLDDTFTVAGFEEPLTRRQIISMLFNMGNESNKMKLLEGYEWSEAQVQEALSNLNEADAAFVQSTWDTIATLWPDMVALEKRSTGVEPKKQEITPYTLRGKYGGVIAEMRGGYWPIKYDPKASEFGEKQLAGDAMRLAPASRPGTSRSALKERTNAVGPLLLSFDYILERHLTDVILDLTHREALNSVHRLIKRKEVKTAIQQAFGDEYYQQLTPWLNTIAGDGSGAAAMGLDKLMRAAMKMRSNTVAAVLGLKATTVIVQFADLARVLGPSDYRVKSRYYFEAFSAFLGDPKGEIARVRELSGEMRHRPENLDRDIREVLKQMTGQQTLKDRYNRAAFKGIAFMDTWISVTSWSGAFKQAMAEHGDSERAIMEADRVVRLKLMSGNPKDLVAVQRSNELTKLITMYLGDATSNYNLMRNAGHQANGLGGFVTQFTPALMIVMAGAVIGDLLKGQGPDDDEDEAAWLIRKSLLAPFQTIPGVRDGVRALDAKLAGKPFSDYQFTPAFAAVQKAINAIDITADMLGDEKDVEFFDWAVKAGEAIGYALGIGGTAQVAASTKYLRRVNEGETVEGAIVDITGSEGAQVAYNATLGKPKKRGN